MIDRILKDKPIIIPDDGKSLWTLTYNKDFAKGFVDVFGNEKTYQNYYHLTSEKVYTWNQIIQSMYDALGKKPNIIYISTDDILEVFPEFKGELYGDKKEDAVFDNSKIKEVAPNYTSHTEYTDVVKEVIAYYLNHKDSQIIDEKFIEKYEKLIEIHQS
jgi:nucleoside-diphosphate-sugar epimerase